MATVKGGELVIDVKADYGTFNDGIAKVTRAVKQMSDDTSGAFASLNASINLVKNSLAALGVAFSIGAAADFIKRTIETTARIKDQADQIGISTQALQILQYQAAATGTSQEVMVTSLSHFTKVLGEANSGSKQAIDFFKGLGVATKDNAGNFKSTEAVYQSTVEAISKVGNEAAKRTREIEAFGKSGQQMANMMEGGAKGIDEATKAAEDYGLVFDESIIAKAQAAQSAWNVLMQQFNAFAELLVIKLAPILTDIMKRISDMLHLGDKDSRLNDAIADANNLLVRCNDEITKVIAKQNELAAATAATAAEDAKITAEYVAQGDKLKALLDIRSRLQANLDEMGERQRDSTLKNAPGLAFSSLGGSGGSTGALPAATKEHDALANAAKQAAQALGNEREALERELAQLHMSGEQIAIDNALRAANLGWRSKQAPEIANMAARLYTEKEAQKANNDEIARAKALTESLRTPQEKYNDDLKELNKLLADNRISIATYNAGLAQIRKTLEESDPALVAMKKAQDDFDASVNQLADDVGGTLADAFLSNASAADKWKAVLTAAIKDVVSVMENLLKMALGGSTGSGAGGMFAGLGSALSGVFGWGPSTGPSAIVGPLAGSPIVAAAGGGHLDTGDWAIVGERGPELVYADTPGTVLTADRTRGIFSGNSGTTVYLDARGADMAAVARIEAGMRQLNATVETRAVAAVNSQRKRGGGFAATFRR